MIDEVEYNAKARQHLKYLENWLNKPSNKNKVKTQLMVVIEQHVGGGDIIPIGQINHVPSRHGFLLSANVGSRKGLLTKFIPETAVVPDFMKL